MSSEISLRSLQHCCFAERKLDIRSVKRIAMMSPQVKRLSFRERFQRREERSMVADMVKFRNYAITFVLTIINSL